MILFSWRVALYSARFVYFVAFFFCSLELVDRELAFMDRDAQKKLEAFEKARTVRARQKGIL